MRNCKWLGFRVPLAIVRQANDANQFYPFAISLIESVRTYEMTNDKVCMGLSYLLVFRCIIIIIILNIIAFIADVINNGQILIYCGFSISYVVSVCLFYFCYIRFLLLYLVVNFKF